MSKVLDLLAEWMPKQRWYAAGEAPAKLRLLGSFEFATSEPEQVRLITVAIVYDDTTGATYQVPLVVRDVDAEVEALGYIGQVREHGDRAALVDGCHDTAFVGALIKTIADERELAGENKKVRAYGQPMPGATIGQFVTSRVLQGEQSNTSIICEFRADDGSAAPPLIIKIFRRLHPGENPDVVLQTAIAAAGSYRVPPAFGALAGVWPEASGQQVAGHLAFATEYFFGVEDAWRVALRAAERGDDFSQLAHSLGKATAEVHEVLQRVLPTVQPSGAIVRDAINQMRDRYRMAAEAVPELRQYAQRINAVYDEAATVDWPQLQRIHGDYHLGQVLAVPERGWVLLDFEGEPLRPLADRCAPDVPQRDVAGMLRSFDYVAGALEVRPGHLQNARKWAQAARKAFLAGYRAGLGNAGSITGAQARARDALLRAYELDKAVYEALYEQQHRPEWLQIPLRAIGELL
ncbi:maltokinase N-terminal cap-like domain-containing protein [uncultured Gulosibacter sp.]|uniref:maltokinase N-terminal cap-like domain-containing protein n=1 Tax=uncultured Gulosibacter sp. TaxID=1339167 RepID=UPI00288B4CC2|nr:phosphotransferase [uncultured Gulosibacter sp.]